MRKHLRHPLRTAGAALTVVGGSIVFFVLILPSIAFGGRPSGVDEVWYYTQNNGNTSHRITHTEGSPSETKRDFAIVGKNLDHASSVLCWDVAGKTYVSVDSWSYGPDSKHLIDVDPADACIGGKYPILVTFSFPASTYPNNTYGPPLLITGSK